MPTRSLRGFGDGVANLPGIHAYADSKRQQLFGVATWSELLRHWHEVLAALAHGYQTGESEVDPLYGECRYCELSTLCRVSERAGAVAMEESDDE